MKDEVLNSHEDNVVEFCKARGFANYINKKQNKAGLLFLKLCFFVRFKSSGL
jgi:hypothetical protein